MSPKQRTDGDMAGDELGRIAAMVSRPRFPGMGRKVTLFVVVAVAALAVLVLAVGWKQGLLARQTRVFFIAPDASGISKGMPVKLLGFHVGKVADMQIKRAEVEVELAINTEYVAMVPVGSHARLAREGLIGASFVEIVPKRDAVGGRSLAENEVIAFERGASYTDAVEDLKRRVEPVVAGLRDTVGWINDPEGDFRQSMLATRRVIDGVPAMQQRFTEFTTQATAVAGSVRDNVGTMGETVNQFARNSSKAVESELPKIAASTSSAMSDVANAARELNRAARATGERLNGASDRVEGTLAEVQGAAADAAELTSAVKRSWPFNRMVGAPQTRTLPIDLNESGMPWPALPASPAATPAPTSAGSAK